MSAPDTSTVTVRKGSPRARKRVSPLGDRRPWIGSQGAQGDLWTVVSASCFQTDPTRGHAWVPPGDLYERVAIAQGAFDAGFDRVDDDGVRRDWVPFDPGCKDCLVTARWVLEQRGCSTEQVRRVFVLLGAKWTWTTPEKRAAARARIDGEFVVDPTGVGLNDCRVTTDKAIQRREQARARRMAQDDQVAENVERAQRTAAGRKVRTGSTGEGENA